jgi:hypothetical protein
MKTWRPAQECASNFPLHSKKPGSFGEARRAFWNWSTITMWHPYAADDGGCLHGISSWPNTRRLAAALDVERRNG